MKPKIWDEEKIADSKNMESFAICNQQMESIRITEMNIVFDRQCYLCIFLVLTSSPGFPGGPSGPLWPGGP